MDSSETLPLPNAEKQARFDDVAASDSYKNLLLSVVPHINPERSLTYVPLDYTEQPAGVVLPYMAKGSSEFQRALQQTDAIICISRDEQSNPDYSDQYPERNIMLTPSGESNVRTSADLFLQATALGNNALRFISSGRMHNRAVRMMLALPLLADYIGINADEGHHIPQAQFVSRFASTFTAENTEKITDRLLILPDISVNQDDHLLSHIASSRQAIRQILEEAGIRLDTITAQPLDKQQIERARDAILAEYTDYPRISTSRLMAERAIELGVTPSAVHEEDGAVDTITNILNVTSMFKTINGNHDFYTNHTPEASRDLTEVKHVIIVAGSDHLPRIAWIADHILPEDIVITLVESQPSLTQQAFDASCARERLSFLKGMQWIGHTNNATQIESITEAGYFGTDRPSARQIAFRITQQ